MIKFRLKRYAQDPDSYYDREGFSKPKWQDLRVPSFRPRQDDFNELVFKINGKEYTEWSKEFEHAWLVHALKKEYD